MAGGRPGGVPGGGGGRLHRDGQVGDPVPQRLEGAQRPAELLTGQQVGDGQLEAALRGAHRLRRQGDVQQVTGVPDRCRPTDQRGGHAREADPGLRTGRVHRVQRGHGQPGAGRLDEPQAVGGGEQQQVGALGVDHLGQRPGQPVAVQGELRPDAQVQVKGCAGRPLGQLAQVLPVPGAGQDDRRHRGGQHRGAQQAAAGLVQDHGCLHEGGARAAVLLGDRQPGQPELTGQPLPQPGGVGQLGAHRGVLGEETADRGPQVAEVVAHALSFGRPQCRSAMMLRWISLLPP